MFIVNSTINERFRVVTSKSSERCRQLDTEINCEGVGGGRKEGTKEGRKEGKEWGLWSSDHYRSSRTH